MTFVYLAFLGIALALIECLIGGTRLAFSLPAYAIISIGAILTLAGLRSRKQAPPDAFCVFSTLLLGGWILWRSWNSPIQYLALPDFLMMIACLMTYLITAFYLSGTVEQTVMIGVLWAISAAEVWVAMVQFIQEPKFMLFGFIRPTYERPAGMYVSPNNFAGLLVAVAMFSVALGIWSRWRAWAKILSFYISVVCLIGAALSGSRGGYFDIIGALLCFVFGSVYAIRVIDPRKFGMALGLSLGGLIAALGIAYVLMSHSQLLSDRMQKIVARDVRIYNWEAAIDHIKVSPWIGTGSGTHLIYGRLFRRPEIQADPVHAHCDYLELIAEYGAVGGLCMAIFLFAHVRRGVRSYGQILRCRILQSGFHHSNSFALQLGALCAVAGLGIHSIVDFDMHVPGNAIIFAFVFGILANPGMDRRLGRVDTYVMPGIKLIAPALGLFMLWYGVRFWPSEIYAEKARISLRQQHFIDSIQFAQLGLGKIPVQQQSDDADQATPDQDPAADSSASSEQQPAADGQSTPAPDAQAAPDQQPEPDFLQRALAFTGGNPRNPDLYTYIGEANLSMGAASNLSFLQKMYFKSALPAFESGLQVFPQDEEALARYAQTLDRLREFSEAEAAYQRLLGMDPNLGVARAFYEDHLRAEGNAAEADALAKQWTLSTPKAVDSGHGGNPLLLK